MTTPSALVSQSTAPLGKLVREIEALVAIHGLYAVTLALAEACFGKADHLRTTNWRDHGAARRWYQAGKRIEKAYRALIKIQLSYGGY